MRKASSTFAVGEIVKIRAGTNAGAICIVEEIVTEPRFGYPGQYSLYGWDQPNPSHRFGRSDNFGEYPKHPSDWYFGDFIGDELESQGWVASLEEVEQYGQEKGFYTLNESGQKSGFGKDIDYIKANLGKSVKVPRRDVPNLV